MTMTMMKSSLMSSNDPFMSDHQSPMAVDPNYFLNDIGTEFKDESQDFSTFPALLEWANMDDSQLENMIFDGFGMNTESASAVTNAPAVTTAPAVTSTLGKSFGTSVEITPNQSPEYDFEEFLNNLKFENGFDAEQQSALTFVDTFDPSNSAVDLTPPLTPVHQTIQDPLSACLFESGIANFEEVSNSIQQQMVLQVCLSENSSTSSDSSQAPSPASIEVITEIADNETAYSEDNGDAESVQSFSSTASSLKRKVKVEDDDDEEYFPPSKKANKGGQAPKRAPRKAPARRNRRVQDERVKNQNKVAAMKYRAKKRDEKSTLDVLYEAEEEKNKKLKSQLEELQVNIDVLKELLGKYLKKK